MFSRLLLSAWPSSRVTTYSRFFTKLFRLSPYDATIRANSLNCSNRTILGRRIGRGSTSLIVASCSASSHDYSPSPRPATLYSQRERERERERERTSLSEGAAILRSHEDQRHQSRRESRPFSAQYRASIILVSLFPPPPSLSDSPTPIETHRSPQRGTQSSAALYSGRLIPYFATQAARDHPSVGSRCCAVALMHRNRINENRPPLRRDSILAARSETRQLASRLQRPLNKLLVTRLPPSPAPPPPSLPPPSPFPPRGRSSDERVRARNGRGCDGSFVPGLSGLRHVKPPLRRY